MNRVQSIPTLLMLLFPYQRIFFSIRNKKDAELNYFCREIIVSRNQVIINTKRLIGGGMYSDG